MKTINSVHFANRNILLFLVLVSGFFLSSCARKMSFTNSAIVPAARGTVKLKTDKNNNSVIDINVMNLAPADKLSPPKEVYIVWMETEKNGTKNIGQLKSSDGFLSNTLKGSLETTSPFKPERFFITAEDNATIQYPGSTVVLDTK